MAWLRRPRDERWVRHRQPAQILVIGSFALLFVLGLLAVVLTLGLYYVERRQLQNRADAMALAATWQVQSNATDAHVKDEANLFAPFNPTDGSPQRVDSCQPAAGHIVWCGWYVPQGTPPVYIGDGVVVPANASGVHVKIVELWLPAQALGRTDLYLTAEVEAGVVAGMATLTQ